MNFRKILEPTHMLKIPRLSFAKPKAKTTYMFNNLKDKNIESNSHFCQPITKTVETKSMLETLCFSSIQK